MVQFKVTGMNWTPPYVSPVTLATIWYQQARHLELASLMAKEEGNGQDKILLVNVSLQ